MNDTKIYIIDTGASVSGVSGPRHLGLAVIKDGKLAIVNGLQV